MTKASDNQYPKVTFLESSAPSTPASTLGYLYEKTDGKVYFKNDGGTEYDLTTSGGGGFSEESDIKDTGGAGDVNTTSTSFVDLTGASVTITTAAVRCWVSVSLMAINSNAGNDVCFDVAIDGTRFANTTKGMAYMQGNNAWEHISFSFFTNVLTAASHTFKIQWRVSANTGGVNHQTTNSPIFLQVVETTLAT
jgi:hypothetical protein